MVPRGWSEGTLVQNSQLRGSLGPASSTQPESQDPWPLTEGPPGSSNLPLQRPHLGLAHLHSRPGLSQVGCLPRDPCPFPMGPSRLQVSRPPCSGPNRQHVEVTTAGLRARPGSQNVQGPRSPWCLKCQAQAGHRGRLAWGGTEATALPQDVSRESPQCDPEAPCPFPSTVPPRGPGSPLGAIHVPVISFPDASVSCHRGDACRQS